jgi:FAD:protein FMN transferase
MASHESRRHSSPAIGTLGRNLIPPAMLRGRIVRRRDIEPNKDSTIVVRTMRRCPAALLARALAWLAGLWFGTLEFGTFGAGHGCSTTHAAERFEFRQVHMGVSFKVLLYAADETTANRAAQTAFARIAELDQAMSDYKPDSELSRLSDASPSPEGIPVSDPLWFVLTRAQELAARSDGAFDITVGPYVKLWRRSRRQKELPRPERIAEAARAVGFRHLELDPQSRRVRLLRPDMRLDLGGIAMGYAVDQSLKLLAEAGIRSALVDASGDIGVTDPPPGEPGWKIGIAPMVPGGPPSRILVLSNAAVTTSGDAFQFVEIEGKRYSHIIDPKTGLGLTDRSAVTVVAPDCITADSVTKAVLVLGPTAGLALIDATPNAAAIIVRAPDGRAEVHESLRAKDLRFAAPRESPAK